MALFAPSAVSLRDRLPAGASPTTSRSTPSWWV